MNRQQAVEYLLATNDRARRRAVDRHDRAVKPEVKEAMLRELTTLRFQRQATLELADSDAMLRAAATKADCFVKGEEYTSGAAKEGDIRDVLDDLVHDITQYLGVAAHD
jgi:hypothetical protein